MLLDPNFDSPTHSQFVSVSASRDDSTIRPSFGSKSQCLPECYPETGNNSQGKDHLAIHPINQRVHSLEHRLAYEREKVRAVKLELDEAKVTVAQLLHTVDTLTRTLDEHKTSEQMWREKCTDAVYYIHCAQTHPSLLTSLPVEGDSVPSHAQTTEQVHLALAQEQHVPTSHGRVDLSCRDPHKMWKRSVDGNKKGRSRSRSPLGGIAVGDRVRLKRIPHTTGPLSQDLLSTTAQSSSGAKSNVPHTNSIPESYPISTKAPRPRSNSASCFISELDDSKRGASPAAPHIRQPTLHPKSSTRTRSPQNKATFTRSVTKPVVGSCSSSGNEKERCRVLASSMSGKQLIGPVSNRSTRLYQPTPHENAACQPTPAVVETSAKRSTSPFMTAMAMRHHTTAPITAPVIFSANRKK